MIRRPPRSTRTYTLFPTRRSSDLWTICDRYFSGILSSTTPNRIYMHAGQTDRLENSVDISALPTVWDRMIEVGRSVAYYYVDVSYTRSEEHTSELQSLMRISYAVFCLKK